MGYESVLNQILPIIAQLLEDDKLDVSTFYSFLVMFGLGSPSCKLISGIYRPNCETSRSRAAHSNNHIGRNLNIMNNIL